MVTKIEVQDQSNIPGGKTVFDYNAELEKVMNDSTAWKNEMDQYREFYQYSAMYPSKSGDSKQKNELRSNMLRVFADKNIHYTSPLPIFKVPTTGADPQMRQAASIREKIIYAVHRASGTKHLQTLWAFDTTVESVAVAETVFDLKHRCMKVKRYDPRFVFWQYSNDNERRVIAFWAVFPITKDEAQRRYGVTPTMSVIDPTNIKTQSLSRIDGKDWYLMAIRWDENTRTAWVGDKFIEKPHNHLMDEIPVDICMPFYDGNPNRRGAFYLEPLVPLQAELNETLRQRANIVRRMANPVIWGRGIVNRQFDETKRALAKPGGGFVGLKQNGELGVLQISDTKMLQEHQADILAQMMRAAGFGAAAFGESVGANTSGDALSMYFNPTQRSIDHQNVSWTAFYESINAKILRGYEKFGKTGEKFKLSGYAPTGTLLSIANSNDQESKNQYQYGGFDIEFDKSVIDGNYTSVAIPQAATPKDELANRRLLMEAVKQGVISRTTAYEEWGIMSPEDELALLRAEQEDPALNPQGVSSIMGAVDKMQGGMGGVQPSTQPGEQSL